MSSKKFPSKILIFGEYSLLVGSSALCIPYNLFEGFLAFKRDTQLRVDSELKSFIYYLKKNKANCSIDIESFEFDVGQGLYFSSTIPQGFGVGSSGALVASIFNRYKEGKLDDDLEKLRECFKSMEGYFHGKSSGIDPLVSYLNQSFLIEKNKLKRIYVENNSSSQSVIFLLNTGRARRTEPLMNLFLEKCKNNNFRESCKRELLPATNQSIDAFLNREISVLSEAYKRISKFQKEHFSPMISTLLEDLWDYGLNSNKFYLKLCGAGGGGFVLGYSENYQEAKEILKDYEIRPVVRL